MPNETYSIVNTLDDGYWTSGIDFVTNNGFLGNFGGVGYHEFLRFRDIYIPQGSIINSCSLELDASASSSVPLDLLVYFNNEDHAVAPTGHVDAENKNLSSSVIWHVTGVWAQHVREHSPELKDILQEIINRSGWTSRNAIMVMVKTIATSPFNCYRQLYDYANGEYFASISINWTAGPRPFYLPPFRSIGIDQVVEEPSVTAEIDETATLDMSLPNLTLLTSTGWNLSKYLSTFILNSSGKIDTIGKLSLFLPPIVLSGLTYGRELGNLSSIIPSLRISANGVLGYTGSFDQSTGAIILRSTTYWMGVNTASLSLPAVYLDARIMGVPAEIIALALNTRNFGLTKYTAYNYNSMCVFNGTLIGAKPTGIHSLTGTDDDGENIEWKLRTGQINLHSNRLREIWLTGKMSDNLLMTVETAEGARYEYNVESVSDTEDSVRIKVGKGIVSEYVVIEFANSSGETIAIDSIKGYGMKL